MSVSKATVLDAFGWFKDLIIADIQESIDAIEPYSLPTASRWQKGGVMIGQDSGLEMSGDYLLVTLKANDYTLPTASATEKGGIIVGGGLSMDGDTLNCTISSGTLDLVTQTDNGLMRATDKVKLDGIANGAQANLIEKISLDGKNQTITNKTAQLDLSAYVKKTEIASGVRMKGSVNSFADLPATAEVGDLYNVKTAGGVDGDGTPVEAGDNVVFTDKGTWDVMAGLIDLSDYAKLTDIAGLSNYTLPTASATEKGGVKVGDGLEMQGDTLNCTVESYTLPTASATEKGGVMIGAGLSMSGDTLNVALKAETYDEFTGATATKSGAKGLVPQPKAGDNKKFLCGDGTWANASELVHVVIGGGSATAMSSGVSTIQGGLWQDFIDGVPVLKLRYGDYEYNFNYDTSNRNGDGTTPLNTTTKGVEYILTTVPSSEDGQLWYVVKDGVPNLAMHKWAFDYFFNYDTITYKGSYANLFSYLPFESTTADACGNISWTKTGTPTLETSPAGGKALRNIGGLKWSGAYFATHYNVVTLDFWLYVDLDKFPANTTAYKIFTVQNQSSNSTAVAATVALTVTNKKITFGGDDISHISKKRTHIAITHPSGGAYRIYVGGELLKTISATNYITLIQLFGTNTTDYPAYIDHFRLFKGQVVWPGDFDPPSPEDYLK